MQKPITQGWLIHTILTQHMAYGDLGCEFDRTYLMEQQPFESLKVAVKDEILIQIYFSLLWVLKLFVKHLKRIK